jgi:hypothetical protein
LCAKWQKNFLTFSLIYSGVLQDQDQVQAVEESPLCPPQATSCQQPSNAATKEDHSNIQKVKKEENEMKWLNFYATGFMILG